MTTHFWGPIANWGLAASGMRALLDTGNKDLFFFQAVLY